jgi:hypothetical protein
MLVSLEVGFQVIFCEPFINLKELSVMEQKRARIWPYLCKRIFFVGMFIPQLGKSC